MTKLSNNIGIWFQDILNKDALDIFSALSYHLLTSPCMKTYNHLMLGQLTSFLCCSYSWTSSRHFWLGCILERYVSFDPTDIFVLIASMKLHFSKYTLLFCTLTKLRLLKQLMLQPYASTQTFLSIFLFNMPIYPLLFFLFATAY
jgi:hypothetical protein